MRTAINRVVAKAKTQEKRDFGFVDIGCFFGAQMEPNQRVEESFELQQGATYVFIASGDDNASDVDLLLYKDGKLIKKDDDSARTAVLVFTCPRKERYSIALRLYRAKTKSSFCSMAVLQKGGTAHHTIPVANLESAIDSCLIHCVDAALVFPSRFHSEANTWALYAAIVPPGGSIQADPKPISAGSYVMVGAVDKSDAKIQLAWLSGRDALAGIDDIHKQAFAAYTAKSGSYSVGVFNRDAAGQSPSLVVTALLDRDRDYLQTMAEAVRQSDTTLIGRWKDSATNQGGQLILIIKDGSVSGLVTNETGRLRSEIRGTLVRGRLEFQYKYLNGEASTAAGILRKGQNDHVVGTLDFTLTSSEERFGQGQVDLTVLPKK